MRPLSSFLAVILTATAGLVFSLSVAQPAAAVDVYTTPGTHQVNGRDWHTTCEPYSRTTRCRTDILATQVTQVGGVFTVRTDWYFNNLTYVESPRTLWAGNPLGNTGAWNAADGRRWRTDCDVSTTGRNGCRSYAQARVIETNQGPGTWKHRWTTKWIFNNIVRFTGGDAPVAPTPPTVTVTSTPTAAPWVDPATIEDPHLRQCIADKLGLSDTTLMSPAALAGVVQLACPSKGIKTLQGMPALPNLTELYLYSNQLATLAGMPDLHNLAALYLSGNQLATLAGMPDLHNLTRLNLSSNQLTTLASMPDLPNLTDLYLHSNQLTTLASMPDLPNLTELDLYNNQLTTLAGMPDLPNLIELNFYDNQLTTLAGIPTLTNLVYLSFEYNHVSDVAPLAGFIGLRDLYLDGNPVVDLSPLDHLVLDGLIIHGP